MIAAYRHFGLNAPPFEGPPDPRFFYRSPAHAEALATLQFAVQSGKACTVIVGESGSGKTLLARLLIQSASLRSGVLWISGIGQPHGDTQATVCLPGSLADAHSFGTHRVEEASLAGWIRSHLARSPATILIVDNADGLQEHSWNDLLAVVTREIRSPKPISLVLLGLPSLANTLAQPALVRLRRRIFRTCQLPRLTRQQSGAYIRERLTVAGREREREIFTPGAVDLIHRLSGGNPALINQICDNALVDAFGDELLLIDAPNIVNTVHAITGSQAPHPILPEPPRSRLAPPPPLAPRSRPFAPAQPAPAAATHDFVDHAAHQPHHQPGDRTPLETARPAAEPVISEVVATAAATARDLTCQPIDERLRALESRLTDALARVRVARGQTFAATDAQKHDAADVAAVDDTAAATPQNK